MKELIQIHEVITRNRAMRKAGDENGYVWAVCGAGVGFMGGVLAPISGVVFTMISWIEGNNAPGPFLHQVGTFCFFLTVPLLILGGCCLDALEKRGWRIGSF